MTRIHEFTGLQEGNIPFGLEFAHFPFFDPVGAVSKEGRGRSLAVDAVGGMWGIRTLNLVFMLSLAALRTYCRARAPGLVVTVPLASEATHQVGNVWLHFYLQVPNPNHLRSCEAVKGQYQGVAGLRDVVSGEENFLHLRHTHLVFAARFSHLQQLP